MAKKILVVDDLEQNRLLLRDVLEYFGYEVVEAGNGEEGVKMAREHLPDLILMDMSMPVMDGYAALHILRSDPLTRAIRVAAITSFAPEDATRDVFAAGADEYIPKPIEIKKLPGLVEKMLGSNAVPAEGLPK
ncbi:MAG TPA: response regulator [Geobacteraceae bacterium]